MVGLPWCAQMGWCALDIPLSCGRGGPQQRHCGPMRRRCSGLRGARRASAPVSAARHRHACPPCLPATPACLGFASSSAASQARRPVRRDRGALHGARPPHPGGAGDRVSLLSTGAVGSRPHLQGAFGLEGGLRRSARHGRAVGRPGRASVRAGPAGLRDHTRRPQPGESRIRPSRGLCGAFSVCIDTQIRSIS